MRRRLTLALLTTSVAAVVLVGLGVLALWQIGAGDRDRAELERQLDAFGQVLDGRTGRNDSMGDLRMDVDRLRPGSTLDRLELVVVAEDGSLVPFTGPDRNGRGERPGPDPAPTDGLPSIGPEAVEELASGATVIRRDGSVTLGLRRLADASSARPDNSARPGNSANQLLALLATRRAGAVPGRATAWFVLSSLFVVVGSLVASRILARRLTTPIEDIRLVTGRLAAGDLAARVAVAGDDEVAELGHSVNRMAGELERSKALDQQFLMSVSHDLRTPLTAISGYAEALVEGATDDAPGAGAVIADHAARLERLVVDLLDLARLDANRFRFDRRRLDLSVTAGRVVAGFQPRAAEYGIDLRFSAAASAPIEADVDRVDQIIGNLISNGLTFARSAVEVDVRVSHQGDGDRCLVSVADDGPGIGDEDLPHVFDRLYVAKAQPARAENPTGLGLAIVRDLTTAMDGSVTVTNRPGGGACFVVSFPSTDGPVTPR